MCRYSSFEIGPCGCLEKLVSVLRTYIGSQLWQLLIRGLQQMTGHLGQALSQKRDVLRALCGRILKHLYVFVGPVRSKIPGSMFVQIKGSWPGALF